MAKEHPFLKLTGLSEKDFYKKYPSPDDFFNEYPQMRNGGNISDENAVYNSPITPLSVEQGTLPIQIPQQVVFDFNRVPIAPNYNFVDNTQMKNGGNVAQNGTWIGADGRTYSNIRPIQNRQQPSPITVTTLPTSDNTGLTPAQIAALNSEPIPYDPTKAGTVQLSNPVNTNRQGIIDWRNLPSTPEGVRNMPETGALSVYRNNNGSLYIAPDNSGHNWSGRPIEPLTYEQLDDPLRVNNWTIDNTGNVVLRPGYQYGGNISPIYEEGNTYDLTPDEIRRLRSLGYDIEISK